MSEVARIFAPLLVWLALFSGVYGLHGLGCGLGWADVDAGPTSLHRAALIAGWGAAIVVQGLVLLALLRIWRSRQPFGRSVTRTLGVAALVATVWTLFPVAFASSCG